MITIRLNCLGFFTQDIDVHVVPPVGSSIVFHGGSSKLYRAVYLHGIVKSVKYAIGRFAYSAIVVTDYRETTPPLLDSEE
jgi:hypothetical protein